MNTQAHVYIIGDVTGVGFRAWTKIHAGQLGVKGWVRNVTHNPHVFGEEGGVEALFQGPAHQVEHLIDLVKRGPTVARVDDVEVFWQTPTEIYPDFEIRRTV